MYAINTSSNFVLFDIFVAEPLNNLTSNKYYSGLNRKPQPGKLKIGPFTAITKKKNNFCIKIIGLYFQPKEE